MGDMCQAKLSLHQDILYAWVREQYSNCLPVGSCTIGDPTIISKESGGFGAGIGIMAKTCTTKDLLNGTMEVGV